MVRDRQRVRTVKSKTLPDKKTRVIRQVLNTNVFKMGNIDMKVRKKQTVKVHIKREKNTVTLIHSFQKFLYIEVLESKLGLCVIIILQLPYLQMSIFFLHILKVKKPQRKQA